MINEIKFLNNFIETVTSMKYSTIPLHIQTQTQTIHSTIQIHTMCMYSMHLFKPHTHMQSNSTQTINRLYLFIYICVCLAVLIFTSLAPTLYKNEKNTQWRGRDTLRLVKGFKLTCMPMFASEKNFMHIIL